MSAEAHYKRLLQLSQRMLASGMAQHWDELVSLEHQRRAMLDNAPLTGRTDLAQPLIDLISQIQACDAELREKLDAWMANARILLRMDKQNSLKP